MGFANRDGNEVSFFRYPFHLSLFGWFLEYDILRVDYVNIYILPIHIYNSIKNIFIYLFFIIFICKF